MHGSCNTDPTGTCKRFNSRRDVDVVAKEVITSTLCIHALKPTKSVNMTAFGWRCDIGMGSSLARGML